MNLYNRNTSNNHVSCRSKTTANILQELSFPTIGEKRLMSCFDTSASTPTKSSSTSNNSLISSMSRECVYPTNSCSNSPNSKSPNTSKRFLPTGPCRILDAPDLLDDYYLNLLHWGKGNCIAVALQQLVYIWHAESGKIEKLNTLEDSSNGPNSDSYITSVQWSNDASNILAVGTSSNTIEIWDASVNKKIRELTGHTSRVSSLSWRPSGDASSLSSGSRDSIILNHDIREARHITSRFIGHQQEVCGLAWNNDGSTLASGRFLVHL